MSDKDDPILIPEDQPIPGVKQTNHDPVLQDNSNSTAVSVDAHSTITPISKQEIEKVDADAWSKCTVSELYDQLMIMEKRKYACMQYSPEIVKDIERGITRLRAIIDKKQGNEVKLL